MVKKIFISYPHQQVGFAEKIKCDLEEHGFEVWLDKVALRHAVIWTQDLTDAISKNDCVLLLWSANAKISENVQKEIITARALLKPIIPFLIEGEKSFPPLPDEIKFIQAVVRENYEEGLKALLIRLQDDELVKREYPISTKKLYVPQNRNPHFVGRQHEIVKLFNDLCGFWGEKSRNNPCAITGLAGIGKTELALEFAYRFSPLFTGGIYWVDADKDDLSSEFIKLASYPELNLQQFSSESKTEFAKRILNRLSNLPDSLLILDGINNSRTFRDWCPKGGQSCAVLITTRHMLYGGRVQLLQLKELDTNSALQLLTSRRTDLNHDKQELAAAQKICTLIGNYPLALEVFAANLAAEPVLTAQSFFDRLSKVPFLTKQTQLEGTFYTSIEEQQNIFTLFDVIYEKLDRSLIDPIFFLASWFSAQSSINYELIENAFGKSEDCSKALSQLKNVSLISFDQNRRIILHPLVTSFARELQDEQTQKFYQRKFVEIITNFVQTNNSLKQINVVLPEVSHVEFAIKNALDNDLDLELKILYTNYGRYLGYRSDFNQQFTCLQKAQLLYEKSGVNEGPAIAALNLEIGRVLSRSRGDYSTAETHFQKALDLYHKSFGLDHAEVANTLSELGNVYYERGDYKEALRQFERALAISKKYYKEDEPHLTNVLQSIAKVHFQLGEYDKAKTEFENILLSRKRHHSGEIHYDIAFSDIEISDLYVHQADYRNALRHLCKATVILKSALGIENVEIAQIYERLGRICLEKAQYSRAVNFFNKSMLLIRRSFSENHPTMARLYTQLSHVYRRKGEFEKAFEYVQLSLQMQKKILGDLHPAVADTLEVLVKIFYHQCKFDDAKIVLNQALFIRKNVYGEGHPSVGNTLHDFGSYHLRKGDFDMAIGYFQQAREISLTVFGENHRDYIERTIDLANAYYQKEDYASALLQLDEVKPRVLNVFGDHPHPIVGRMWLGFSEVLRRLGHFEKAKDCITTSLNVKRKIYGELHPSYAESLESLVKIYYHYCQFDKAKPVLEHILKSRKRAYGETHPHPLIGNTLHDFGSYYLRKAEFETAISYFRQACDISLKAFGERHPEYIERSINLAYAIYLTNDYDGSLAELKKIRALIQAEFGESPNRLEARMRLLLSEVYRRQSEFERAEVEAMASLDIKKKIYKEFHPSIADALEVLVRIYYHLCRFDEAQDVNERALKIRHKAYGDQHPLVGNTLHDFGSLHLRKGEYDKAIQYFQKALDISRVAFQEEHPEYIERSINLANAYYQKNDYSSARDLLHETEKLAQKVFHGPHPLTARMLLTLGEVYRRLGEFSEALVYANKSLEMKREIYVETHPSIADAFEVLARIYNHQYNFEESQRSLQKALEIRTKAYKPDHPLVGNTLHEFGWYYLRRGEVGPGKGERNTAIDCFKESLEIQRKFFGANNPDTIDRQVSLAMAYRLSGHIDRAFEQLKSAEEISEQTFDHKKHPVVARAFLEFSHLWRKRGDFREADRYIMKSIKMKEDLYGKNHPSLAEALQAKAKLQIQYQQFSQAEDTLSASLSMRIKAYKQKHPEVANALNEIGCLLSAMGRHAEALQKHEESYNIKKSYYGESHPELGKIFLDMGIAYRHLEDAFGDAYDRAMSCLVEAFNIDNRFLEPDHTYLAKITMEMGITLAGKKDYQGAIAKLQDSLEIYERNKNIDLREWAANLDQLGLIYIQMGTPEAALTYLKSAFKKKKELYIGNHPDLAKTLYLQGKAARMLSKLIEAKEHFDDAARICRETSTTDGSLYQALQDELKNISNLGRMGDR